MTKTELIIQMAETTGMTKKESESALNAALQSISEALIRGETVKIHGFGVFEVRKNAARMRRNPQTNQAVSVKAYCVPRFRPGQFLRDAVAKFQED